MKYLRNLLLLIFVLSSNAISGQIKVIADSAYEAKDYSKAVEIYERILSQGKNSSIYYNLGNCYYRLNDYPKSVLNYERCLWLDPSNSDARYNLTLTNLKIKDQLIPKSEMFFVTWTRKLVNWMNVDGWATIGLISFTICLVFLLSFSFLPIERLRKACFVAALCFLLFSVVVNIFAMVQKFHFDNDNKAVLMLPSKFCATPTANPKQVGELHEGTSVNIVDTSIAGWFQIELIDGRIGWIESNKVELVKSK